MRTLKTVAEAIQTEADNGHPWFPIYNFLNDYSEAQPDERHGLLQACPPSTGNRTIDAYLGAIGEHFGLREGSVPDWARNEQRFLDYSWFVPPNSTHRTMALIESPAAFRRRGIYVMRNDVDSPDFMSVKGAAGETLMNLGNELREHNTIVDCYWAPEIDEIVLVGYGADYKAEKPALDRPDRALQTAVTQVDDLDGHDVREYLKGLAAEAGSPIVADMAGLRIVEAPSKRILGMTVAAGAYCNDRGLRKLCQHLKLSTTQQVLNVVERQTVRRPGVDEGEVRAFVQSVLSGSTVR